MTPEEEFHAHLAQCPQCEKNPFNLCPAGHALLMATGKGPKENPEKPETEEDLRTRLNRQVSQLRSKDQHRLDCICRDCLIDWHDSKHWPTLFLELPRNTFMYRTPATAEGTPDGIKVCGCYSEGMIRICQEGQDPGTTVVTAWIAFTLGSRILGNMPDLPFTVPGSNTVH